MERDGGGGFLGVLGEARTSMGEEEMGQSDLLLRSSGSRLGDHAISSARTPAAATDESPLAAALPCPKRRSKNGFGVSAYDCFNRMAANIIPLVLHAATGRGRRIQYVREREIVCGSDDLLFWAISPLL